MLDLRSSGKAAINLMSGIAESPETIDFSQYWTLYVHTAMEIRATASPLRTCGLLEGSSVRDSLIYRRISIFVFKIFQQVVFICTYFCKYLVTLALPMCKYELGIESAIYF